MDLPKVIGALINAQNTYDSTTYAKCFSETATVFDEGKTYTGRSEIKQWIEQANKKYQTVVSPIAYEEKGAERILTVDVSGTFAGSPITMNYHLTVENGLIQSLKII